MRSPARLLSLGVSFGVVLSVGPRALGQDEDIEPLVGPPPPVTQPAGKPVAFDEAWLEPFFTKGPGKLGVDAVREENWAAAESAFAKAVKALKKGSAEQLAAKYMLALARENQSKWGDAGSIFEELYESYPRLAPYHAYHAARCRLRRGDAQGARGRAEARAREAGLGEGGSDGRGVGHGGCS